MLILEGTDCNNLYIWIDWIKRLLVTCKDEGEVREGFFIVENGSLRIHVLLLITINYGFTKWMLTKHFTKFRVVEGILVVIFFNNRSESSYRIRCSQVDGLDNGDVSRVIKMA